MDGSTNFELHACLHPSQSKTQSTLSSDEQPQPSRRVRYLVRAVGPLVGLVHEALHEGLPVGVDGLGHVHEVVLLWVDEGVEAVVQETTVRDRGDHPPEEVIVTRHLWVGRWVGGGKGIYCMSQIF